MAVKGIDFNFTGPTVSIANYDQTKTNLGTLIKQYTGAGNEDKFAGPIKGAILRPTETSFSQYQPYGLKYSDTIDWIFLPDQATAAATRRIALYLFNKETSVWTYNGFITLTYPTATAHTVRGLYVTRDLYTTGTVAVSGTAVTGSGTTWNTDRLSVGCRIGFGSTNPTQITTWYEISAIGSDTGITLTGSAGTISAGTSYVIEEMMVVTTTTNATTTNGGLFVAKGIRYELFTPAGTTISAAVSTDRIRAVYWLSDAATTTNTTACGLDVTTRASWTDHRAYVMNATAGSVGTIFVYNIRAALTLTSGKDTTTNIIKTGNQTVTGTFLQVSNGIVRTPSHGPGSGTASLYFVTTTRIYRSAISNITAGTTTWQSDVMTEVPPGSSTTFALGASFYQIEYDGIIDRFIIFTAGTAGIRSYVATYQTTGAQFEHIFLIDSKQQDQSTADANTQFHPSVNALGFTSTEVDGILYISRVTTGSANNQIYVIPIGAHRTYAGTTNQTLISPKFDISDSVKLYRVSVRSINELGTDKFSIPTEPFDVYYRTTGISDNSGGWTLIDKTGDLSAASGTEIQFQFRFRTIGNYCIPGRITGLSLTYEDSTTDSHYTPSVNYSSIASNIFAYRQNILWSSTIPTLRIRLYNASSGSLILDDYTNTNTYGTFQYSTDGVTWNSWSTSADAVGNYIRYTATSLPGSVKIKALLTQ